MPVLKLSKLLPSHSASSLTLGSLMGSTTHFSNSTNNSFNEEIGLPFAQDTPTLLQQFYKLWKRRPPNLCAIKKVDVCVAGLVPASEVSRPLFDEVEKLQRLSQTIDKINERWGSSAVYFGPLHDYRHPMENKIAFGRIPDEVD